MSINRKATRVSKYDLLRWVQIVTVVVTKQHQSENGYCFSKKERAKTARAGSLFSIRETERAKKRAFPGYGGGFKKS